MNDYVVAVAKPTKNATSTNPNDFIFHSNYNTMKILSEGIIQITSGNNSTATVSVNHNLGKRTGFILFWQDPHFSGLFQFHDNRNRSVTINGDGSLSDVREYRVTGRNDINTLYIDYYEFEAGSFTINVKYYILEVAGS